jgi:hypothetical protein
MKKSVTLIVKRGALRRFDRLKREAAEFPVDVMWDRRQGQRRNAASHSTPEKRKRERRQPPAFTWEVADFVVAEDARTTRKKK